MTPEINVKNLNDKIEKAKASSPVIKGVPGTGATELPLDSLKPFKNHPFLVKDDEDMDELVASIKANGVLEPGLARPTKTKGVYEIVRGHRRHRACQLAGLPTMPFVIREMDNDEATVQMVDSNKYRTSISHSEKAKAYKMLLAALKHQGKAGGRSDESAAEQAGESARTIQRYAKLASLSSPLLAYVDQGLIPVLGGVELADLDKLSQENLQEVLEAQEKPKKVSVELCKELKRVAGLPPSDGLTVTDIEDVLQPEPKVQSEKWDLKEKDLDPWFKELGLTPSEKKAIVLQAVAHYHDTVGFE